MSKTTKGRLLMTALKSGAQALVRRATQDLNHTGFGAVESARTCLDEAQALLAHYVALTPDGDLDETGEPEPRKAARR